MGVDIADAEAMETLTLDQVENFVGRCDGRLKLSLQHPDDDLPLADRSKSNLAEHEGVNQSLFPRHRVAKARVGASEMIDPDRRIDDDHAGSLRRRGAAVA